MDGKTQVISYLKIDGHFVRVEECVGPLRDESYIEGAIECVIDGRSLLSLEHWDLVDQLWLYLLDGVESLQRGEAFECCFPDQPLLLRSTPIAGNWVEVTIGDRTQKFEQSRLVTLLVQGAIDFFEALSTIARHGATWQAGLARSRGLRQ